MEQINSFSDFISTIVPALFYGALAVGYIWTLSDSATQKEKHDKKAELSNDTEY